MPMIGQNDCFNWYRFLEYYVRDCEIYNNGFPNVLQRDFKRLDFDEYCRKVRMFYGELDIEIC